MRSRFVLLFASAAAVISSVQAQNQPRPDADFTGALSVAAQKCSLAAMLYTQANRAGNEDPTFGNQYNKACADGASEGSEAFKKALASMVGHEPSVKKVYAAWMTYMDAIGPDTDASFSPAKTALDQAENELYLEIVKP